ncbi:MAG: ATP-NAD kinase family protein [Idiomarina sp.]
MTQPLYRIGLIINPFAGLGGSVGLKGSDGAETVAKARELGATEKAGKRVESALALLTDYKSQLQFVTVAGAMGADLCEQMGFDYEVAFEPQVDLSAQDTRAAAKQLANANIDLLLFAGGDGTARDICASYPDDQPVLGIPAGVKIHSGVYAISPKAAGRVVELLISGNLTSVLHADVMDIDEEKFRRGEVRARRYGEMLVPAELRYIQAVKMGGKESNEMVLANIAADVIERMEDELWVMGSGSTVAAIMEDLGLPNTLLGVDVVYQQQVIAADVTASQLEALLKDYDETRLVVTLIGGQGHILGRGNQQLSPAVIRHIGKQNMHVVATKAKLQALNGRPLLVDSGDAELDAELAGFIRVITGYHDEVMLSIAAVD